MTYDTTLQYHGGTNFGRTAGGPFIATSYDYDAPIDEYGELNTFYFGKSQACIIQFASISSHVRITAT